MGKNLIIKGADFSAVAVPGSSDITWYIDRCIPDNLASPGAAGLGWAVPNSYAVVRGHTINIIKVKVGIPGTVTVAVLSGNGSSVSVLAQRTIDLSNEVEGAVVTRSFADMQIPSNGYLAVNAPNDTGTLFYQGINGTGQQGFKYRVGSANVAEAPTWDLGISFGYRG